MGHVIQMHRTTQAQARGASIATACMANRYRLTPDQSRDLALQAKVLVERGFSAAHARSAMLRKAQRMAPSPEAA